MKQEIVKQDSVFTQLARKYKITEQDLLGTLKNTIMKPDKTGRPVSDAEVITFLLVASKYDLNPFTREIYAFPDKRAGIVPIVGVDGFITLANRQPELNGYQVTWADEMVTNEGARQCPSWCEVKVFRKDREHPTIVREYLDEVYREPFKSKEGYVSAGPWQTHTKRMLRHKALIQALRIAFGFVGIYDEDEAERIIEVKTVSTKPANVKDPEAIAIPSPAPQEREPAAPNGPENSEEKPPEPNADPRLGIIEQLAIKVFRKNKKDFKDWLTWAYNVGELSDLPADKIDDCILKLTGEENKS